MTPGGHGALSRSALAPDDRRCVAPTPSELRRCCFSTLPPSAVSHPTGTTKKFLYNYKTLAPDGSVNPHDSVTGLQGGSRSGFQFRSRYRGKARGFEPGSIVSGSGFWGYEEPSGLPGTIPSSTDSRNGPVAFLGTLSAGSLLSGVTFHSGFFDNESETSLPANPRDMTYAFGGILVAITAGIREVYLLTSNGSLTTIALPEEPP